LASINQSINQSINPLTLWFQE